MWLGAVSERGAGLAGDNHCAKVLRQAEEAKKQAYSYRSETIGTFWARNFVPSVAGGQAQAEQQNSAKEAEEAQLQAWG